MKLFIVKYGRNGVDLCSSSSTVAMAAVSTWRRAIETLRASSTFAEFARMLEILRLTLTGHPTLNRPNPIGFRVRLGFHCFHDFHGLRLNRFRRL